MSPTGFREVELICSIYISIYLSLSNVKGLAVVVKEFHEDRHFLKADLISPEVHVHSKKMLLIQEMLGLFWSQKSVFIWSVTCNVNFKTMHELTERSRLMHGTVSLMQG